MFGVVKELASQAHTYSVGIAMTTRLVRRSLFSLFATTANVTATGEGDSV